MKTITPFPNEDLKLIRWELFIAIISILICTGIYLGSNYLNDQAHTDLNNAQAEYRRAQSAIELIEEEEATIIEYIGRYQEILEEGGIEPEDRVQILETFAEIRAEYSLFPIDFLVDKQSSFSLKYDPSVRDPGAPINLNSSPIEMNLPLLHEEDLSRLLEAISISPGIFQTQRCGISLNSDLEDFSVLAQHQHASCSLLWYTFDLDSVTREG